MYTQAVLKKALKEAFYEIGHLHFSFENFSYENERLLFPPSAQNKNAIVCFGTVPNQNPKCQM